MQNKSLQIRSTFVHCLADPSIEDAAVEHLADGVLSIENGHVTSLAQFDPSIHKNEQYNDPYIDLRGKVIVPGFVDTHIHYPQLDIIASYGEQLLQWLEKYTFPKEASFGDEAVASSAAEFFLDELISNGTTTALVFGTTHKESVEAFFNAALKRKLRMICGKVMMDRNAPNNICDTPQSGYDDSKALIEKWHNKDRLGYAVTPRFAPTSSSEQLAMAGKLLREYPTVHLHTHISENQDECDWVAKLFPQSDDYLSVYETHGLVKKRSVFAHGLHLSDSEWQRISEADAAVAHCPCSNLFIGSGLFNAKKAFEHKVNWGLGSDVGGGDSFSLLRVCNEAYKVQQLQGNKLSPLDALYRATLGGAVALDLDHHIGNFETGKEADFVVLDPQATPLLKRRSNSINYWQDQLFALLMLGDDRAVYDTYIMGQSVKRKATMLDDV
ncbi:MAG: guanine deaminase [Granulosicoccaceae bacterium]